jgi:hypothetical protein
MTELRRDIDAVAGRHLDVEQCHVGTMLKHAPDDLIATVNLVHDLDVRLE